MLKVLLRVIAVPVLILFVVVFPISLLLKDVGALLFESDTTRALIRESLMGSELAASLARRGTQQMFSEREPANTTLDSDLDEEEWRQITEIIAPEELVGDTVDQVVGAFSQWLNGSSDQIPDLSIDLGALKSNALQRADEVMAVVLASLPACTAEAAMEMAAQGASGLSIPACAPPEPLYSELIERADSLMAGMIGATPGTIDLNQIMQNSQSTDELLQLRTTLQRLQLALGWGWSLVLAIGVLAGLMAATGLRSFLVWFGWPLLVAGLLTLTIGLALLVFSFSFLDQVFAVALGEGSVAMSVLGGAMAGGALNLVSQPLLLQGLVTLVAGIVAVMYARSLQRKEQSPGIPINRRRIGL